MRYVLTVAVASLVCVAIGCTNFQQQRPRPVGHGGEGGGVTRMPDRPTAQTLVAYLNDNARRVPGFESAVDIDCKQGSDTAPGLQGQISCQKPRDFRLTAKVLGKSAVDVGSNDQEFWFWVGQNNPAYVYYCSYDDFGKQQVKMPFPFQPDMIVTALGIQDYDEKKLYELKTTARTYELIEQTTSPQGQQLQKVIIFSKQQERGDRPQIVGYALRDARGKEICTATVTQVQTASETGGVLPRRIKFVWPEEKIEMSLKMENVKVQSIDPKRAEVLFSRKTLNQFQSYNLAQRGGDNPTSRIRGAMPEPR
jgi:hypothetical protein